MSVEIMQVADQVAREKGIDRDVVIAAMETAIQTASRKKYGANKNIQAKLDPKSGEFHLQQLREVVLEDDFMDEDQQICLEDAQLLNPNAQVGDFIADDLPPIEFGRIAAQTAKQVIFQKVREAEREGIFQEYADRKGTLVNGVVKRVERNNIYVELGRAAALLPYEEQLPREHYRQGDRIRAFIADVRDVTRGPQIILSRTHPQMIPKLFEMEVPEIYDGVVEIVSVARDAGYRSKIAVRTNDSHVDPVGACVGMRGSRVQGVVTELQGERIDIIQWSHDPAVFVCNALAPAEVSKVVLDEDERSIKVVVREDQLSLSIGRRGQNVRLAAELTGWKIDIVTEQEESDKHVLEFEGIARTFMEALDIEEDVATALIQEGFSSTEEVAYIPLEELAKIEGFDEEIAKELRNRARESLLQKALVKDERATAAKERSAKPAKDLFATLLGLSAEMHATLKEKGISKLDDLADLATDELLDLLENGLAQHAAEQLILEARKAAGWFDEDKEKG